MKVVMLTMAVSSVVHWNTGSAIVLEIRRRRMAIVVGHPKGLLKAKSPERNRSSLSLVVNPRTIVTVLKNDIRMKQ